jgi:hypothetical protein
VGGFGETEAGGPRPRLAAHSLNGSRFEIPARYRTLPEVNLTYLAH